MTHEKTDSISKNNNSDINADNNNPKNCVHLGYFVGKFLNVVYLVIKKWKIRLV